MKFEALARIIAGLPLPAIVVGEKERVQAANDGARLLFGDAIVGRHLAMAIRTPGLLQAVAEVGGEDGGPREVRCGLSRQAGEETYLATVSAVGEGAVLCVFRDVTEEERAGQMRRDFVANVSHELRTPLTALMGFIETLRFAAKDDPVARERFLSIMEQEAGRMNRLVRDLLHLSRVEAEERVRPRERVELMGIIAGVVDRLAPQAAAAGARVVVEEAGPVEMAGDGDQLTQVFTNLIENAVKYGGAGEGRGSVGFEDTIRGRAVRVEVADEGEGIAAVHLPRLTERFYRVDSHRSREKGGTGLGLAIVKHIVSRHRGWLRVESEPGEGSRFSVVLPLG